MKKNFPGLPGWLALLILAGLLLVLVFGWRAISSFRHLRGAPMRPGPDAGEIDKIRGWMTVPYVARLYNIPEGYLWKKIGLSAEGNQASSLAELTVKYYPEHDLYVLNQVKAAVRDFFLERPPRPPIPGTPPMENAP